MICVWFFEALEVALISPGTSPTSCCKAPSPVLGHQGLGFGGNGEAIANARNITFKLMVKDIGLIIAGFLIWRRK